jgi:hypothetical protein
VEDAKKQVAKAGSLGSPVALQLLRRAAGAVQGIAEAGIRRYTKKCLDYLNNIGFAVLKRDL